MRNAKSWHRFRCNSNELFPTAILITASWCNMRWKEIYLIDQLLNQLHYPFPVGRTEILDVRKLRRFVSLGHCGWTSAFRAEFLVGSQLLALCRDRSFVCSKIKQSQHRLWLTGINSRWLLRPGARQECLSYRWNLPKDERQSSLAPSITAKLMPVKLLTRAKVTY